MALPDIEEALERTIFHALRSKIVAEGYLPDINDFDTQNTNVQTAAISQKAYKAAIAAIVANKGFAIEIFNNSVSQQRGTMKAPRIVIDTQAFLPGQLGHDTTLQYSLGANDFNPPDVDPQDFEIENYSGNRFVSMTSDFYYSVRLVANTTKQIRVLHGIMVSVLPRRGYIHWYGDSELRPSGNLLNRYVSNFDHSLLAEGIIEKVYRYEIPDAHEIDPITLVQVSPIKQIEIPNINLNIENP